MARIIVTTDHLADLRANARYARERYQLYKAKTYGQRATSATRLRELQRLHEQADARLRFAEAEEKRRDSVGDSCSSHLTPGQADNPRPCARQCIVSQFATARALTLPPSSDQRSVSRSSRPNAAARRAARPTGSPDVGGGSPTSSVRQRAQVEQAEAHHARGRRDLGQSLRADRAVTLQETNVDVWSVCAHANTTCRAARDCARTSARPRRGPARVWLEAHGTGTLAGVPRGALGVIVGRIGPRSGERVAASLDELPVVVRRRCPHRRGPRRRHLRCLHAHCSDGLDSVTPLRCGGHGLPPLCPSEENVTRKREEPGSPSAATTITHSFDA